MPSVRKEKRQVGYKIKTKPTAEPVSIDDAKAQVRYSGDDSETLYLLEQISTLAREQYEHDTNLQLMPATWNLTLDCLPANGIIYIEKSPLQSVTSIKYYDADNQMQTFDSSKYIVDTGSDPGRIQLKYGESWPSLYNRVGAVIIEFIAGYADAGSVPEADKGAIKQLIGHYFVHREAVISGTQIHEIPFGYDFAVNQRRISRF